MERYFSKMVDGRKVPGWEGGYFRHPKTVASGNSHWYCREHCKGILHTDGDHATVEWTTAPDGREFLLGRLFHIHTHSTCEKKIRAAALAAVAPAAAVVAPAAVGPAAVSTRATRAAAREAAKAEATARATAKRAATTSTAGADAGGARAAKRATLKAAAPNANDDDAAPAVTAEAAAQPAATEADARGDRAATLSPAPQSPIAQPDTPLAATPPHYPGRFEALAQDLADAQDENERLRRERDELRVAHDDLVVEIERQGEMQARALEDFEREKEELKMERENAMEEVRALRRELADAQRARAESDAKLARLLEGAAGPAEGIQRPGTSQGPAQPNQPRAPGRMGPQAAPADLAEDLEPIAPQDLLDRTHQADDSMAALDLLDRTHQADESMAALDLLDRTHQADDSMAALDLLDRTHQADESMPALDLLNLTHQVDDSVASSAEESARRLNPEEAARNLAEIRQMARLRRSST
ncbi:hypothetical protein Ddc_15038 [Ditylenchus destructor]|nr:hypothetical protein Ddc_15038 [Ditylenchus destructor]